MITAAPPSDDADDGPRWHQRRGLPWTSVGVFWKEADNAEQEVGKPALESWSAGSRMSSVPRCDCLRPSPRRSVAPAGAVPRHGRHHEVAGLDIVRDPQLHGSFQGYQ